MKDALVILCENTDDALRAAQRVALIGDITKLFLFIGAAPKQSDLDWLSEDDLYIHIENAASWSRNLRQLAVKAGIAYTSGMNVYVCDAKRCPSESDFRNMRTECDTKGITQNPKSFGISRERFVLFDIESPKQSKDKGMEMAKAMRGETVDEDIAIEAMLELAPLRTVKIINEPGHDLKLKKLYEMIMDRLSGLTQANGESKIMFAEDITPRQLEEQIKTTKQNACVVLVVRKEQEALFNLAKAYRKIGTQTCFIGIFRGDKNDN